MGMREKLIELLTDAMPSCYSDTFASQIAVHLIANGVTIPVRCKDCKHWERYGKATVCGKCKYLCCMRIDDDFCSYGERKDNDSNNL